MKTLSNLIGKPVVSILNGRIEGIVKNILIDKKLTKVLALQIFDDNTQEEKVVDNNSVYNIGQDAITIKNSDCVLFDYSDKDCFANPIGKKIFTITGNLVGYINDIQFENGKTTGIVTGTTKILSSNILSAGDHVVILKPQKNFSLKNFKNSNKIPQTKAMTKVQIQNKITPPQKPKKITTNNVEFLLGRKLSNNIYADNGELLAKKGAKINSFVIDNICKNGKLKELTSLSL